jgi:hypothetical protein
LDVPQRFLNGLRHGLEKFTKRLSALEALVASEGVILTEAQVIAMERKKDKLEAIGEIETEHPLCGTPLNCLLLYLLYIIISNNF